ncbi:MAG: DUF5615 family PIN-like protein [Acidobacteriota bacterium]|nr:DUF5615 family PIN-like protein [Acidobacteriota bacterium]
MKLLLDHNISHKLVARLADLFPNSTQTRLLNFGRTNDPQLWLFAKTHGYVFVTKDSDVAELAILRGAPPKIIWLRMGNCKTVVIERTLRANIRTIADFASDPDRIVLELFD